MTLDSILNILVPAGIFIFLGVLIYHKAKKPIDSFAAIIKGWFKKEDLEAGGGEQQGYSIQYQEPDY